MLGAIGGAVALTGGGALTGMNIGSTYGETAGDITTGSANVLTNSRPAARTLADVAVCDEHNLPQQIATGSTTVFINGRPAARLGDHTVCDARISTASTTVVIGGGTGTYAAINGEVPAIAVTIARDMAIGGTAIALGAGGAAAFAAAGWAGVGVFGLQAGGGLAGGALGSQAGGAIGSAIDPVHGGAWGQAIGSVVGGVAGGGTANRYTSSLSDAEVGGRRFPYSPVREGETEPGAVPNTPEIQAQIEAADSVSGRSAPGYPDLPANQAKNFGDDVRPWNGDVERRCKRFAGRLSANMGASRQCQTGADHANAVERTLNLDIATGMTDLATKLQLLRSMLDERARRSSDKAAAVSMLQAAALISRYREAVINACANADEEAALRSVNRATGIYKGLSDEGAWIALEPEVAKLGDESSQTARYLARKLRASLGLAF